MSDPVTMTADEFVIALKRLGFCIVAESELAATLSAMTRAIDKLEAASDLFARAMGGTHIVIDGGEK